MQVLTNPMSYLLQSEEMIYFVKGALERIVSRCTHFYNDGATTPMNDKQRSEYSQEAFKMGTKGLRGLYDNF